MALNREQIGKAKRKAEAVSVPDWNGEILLGVMSGTQLGEFQTRTATLEGKREKQAELFATVILCTAVNADGSPLFTETDLPTILDLSWPVLLDVATKALKLNGMGAKDVENLEKN